MNPPERIRRKRPPGRPPIDIDWKTFEGLCGIQCTQQEICDVLQISVTALEAACKREHSLNFRELYQRFASKGKSSVRRAMYTKALTTPSIMIWWSKNHLGMTDKIETKNETDLKATVTEWVAEFTPLKPKSDSET